jgi:hypothetical protein
MMALYSPGLSVCLRIPSILAMRRSVSSTRVPTGARTRMMNWLSSDGGKNSVPMKGTSPRVRSSVARTPPITVFR